MYLYEIRNRLKEEGRAQMLKILKFKQLQWLMRANRDEIIIKIYGNSYFREYSQQNKNKKTSRENKIKVILTVIRNYMFLLYIFVSLSLAVIKKSEEEKKIYYCVYG